MKNEEKNMKIIRELKLLFALWFLCITFNQSMASLNNDQGDLKKHLCHLILDYGIRQKEVSAMKVIFLIILKLIMNSLIISNYLLIWSVIILFYRNITKKIIKI